MQHQFMAEGPERQGALLYWGSQYSAGLTEGACASSAGSAKWSGALQAADSVKNRDLPPGASCLSQQKSFRVWSPLLQICNGPAWTFGSACGTDLIDSESNQRKSYWSLLTNALLITELIVV